MCDSRLLSGNRCFSSKAKYSHVQEKADENGWHLTTPDGNQGIDFIPFFMVNLIMIFHTIDSHLRLYTLNQYLYNTMAENILGNFSIQFDTVSQPCLQDEKLDNSSWISQEKDKIQVATTNILFQLELTQSLITMVTIILLGILSNRLSRKIQILIPKVGFTLRSLCICLVIYFGLNVNWLFVGSILEGLSAGKPGIFLGTHLYTTDVTPRDRKRTIGISILEGSRGLISAIVALVAGVFIQNLGFMFTANIALMASIVSIMCILLLPDRRERNESKTRISIKDNIGIFLHPNTKLRYMIIIGSLINFISLCANFGVEHFRILYLMNSPICWGAITIALYMFIRAIIINTAAITSIPLLYQYFPGVGIGILGTAANMMEYFTYATASHESQIWFSLVFSVGRALIIIVIRGETSRLVGQELQGPLFGNLAFQDSVSFTISTLSLLVYKSTISFFPGLVFIVMVAVNIIVICLLAGYQKLWNEFQN